MALWRCRACGTSFAVGLPYCPQCTSTDHEEDDGMPKNTVLDGASNADLPDDPANASGEAVRPEIQPDVDRLQRSQAEPSAADGTVSEVLGRVGDDPKRAREALDAERAKDKPRSTLVAELEARAASEEDRGDGEGDLEG